MLATIPDEHYGRQSSYTASIVAGIYLNARLVSLR